MATATDQLITEISWRGMQDYVRQMQAAGDAQGKLTAEEKRAQAVHAQTRSIIQANIQSWQAQAAAHQRVAMTAGLVSAAMLGVGIAAVRSASEVERATIAFGTLLGSQQRGAAFVGQLREFARPTPFQFRDLLPLSQQLMAYKFDPSEILPMLRILGDMAAAMGGDPELLKRTIRAFGQMRAKGRVSGEELLQLSEAGYGAEPVIRKAFGIGPGEDIGRAHIPAESAIRVLLRDMNAQFGGAMAAQMETITGKISTFEDAVYDLKVSLGTALIPTVKEVTGVLTDATGLFGSLPEGATRFVALAGGVALVATTMVGATAAVSAYTLSQRAMAAQLQLTNMELAAQGIAIRGAGVGGALATGVRWAAGLATAGAAGYAIGGALPGASNAGAVGGLLGAGAAGALAGGLFTGNVFGAAAGAIVGMTTAVVKATSALNEMAKKSSEGAIAMGLKARYTFIPASQLTEQGARAARAGGGVAIRELSNEELGRMYAGMPPETAANLMRNLRTSYSGGMIMPSANVPASWEDMVKKGWNTKTIWDRLAPGAREAQFGNWYAGLVPVGTMQTPGKPRASAESTAAEAQATAGLHGALRAEFTAYMETMSEAELGTANWVFMREKLLASFDKEAEALRQEAAAHTAAGSAIDASKARTEALNVEKAKAAYVTEEATRREREYAAALKAVANQLDRVSGGAQAYIGILQRMGVPAGSAYMREAARYQYQAGASRARFGDVTGDPRQYYAGINEMLDAEDAWLGPGLRALGRPGWALKPQDVLEPWAFGRMQPPQDVMNVKLNVYLQTPQEWLLANAQGIQRMEYWRGG